MVKFKKLGSLGSVGELKKNFKETTYLSSLENDPSECRVNGTAKLPETDFFPKVCCLKFCNVNFYG